VYSAGVKFTYRKKTFLAPAPGDTSSILLEAEDSEGGKKKSGHYMVSITDSRHRVDLDFYLGTATHRKQSLAKLDLLINCLTEFRQALVAESNLIKK
jgi:hypothetical protein